MKQLLFTFTITVLSEYKILNNNIMYKYLKFLILFLNIWFLFCFYNKKELQEFIFFFGKYMLNLMFLNSKVISNIWKIYPRLMSLQQ